MKKILSLILVCILTVGCMTALVSCGGLSGTYDGAICDLKFKGDKVTVIIGDNSLTGEYEIKKDDDGNKTITFDFVDEDEATDDEKEILDVIDSLLKGNLPFMEDGNKITIAYVFVFEKK